MITAYLTMMGISLIAYLLFIFINRRTKYRDCSIHDYDQYEFSVFAIILNTLILFIPVLNVGVSLWLLIMLACDFDDKYRVWNWNPKTKCHEFSNADIFIQKIINFLNQKTC